LGLFLWQKIFQLLAMPLNIYMENQTITVTDLATLRSVIDLACTRGAFKGEEMKEVGELFDKLTVFLAAVTLSDCKSALGEVTVVDMCFSFRMFVKHRLFCDRP
jgi:hypothetical protein